MVRHVQTQEDNKLNQVTAKLISTWYQTKEDLVQKNQSPRAWRDRYLGGVQPQYRSGGGVDSNAVARWSDSNRTEEHRTWNDVAMMTLSR